ncbi:hypothetical protein [uncultured Paludibaculum sp.]|uniref:hypothetical protein n=1 Tax=uncultured Paludibaculum sp. TaxID=1765020 RepID=UPI002AAA65D5|nr:hypothetical protein [uncultured Paludibaculum sp.]
MDGRSLEDFRHRNQILTTLGIPVRTTIWLRPGRTTPLPGSASKIGGVIAWPADVPWPVCDGGDTWLDEGDVQNDYFTPLAQFRQDDFPELPFPANSNILQLLWCPSLHDDPHSDIRILGPRTLAFWHRIDRLQTVSNPTPRCARPGLIPGECAFQPLRMADPPPWWLLTAEEQDRFVNLVSAGDPALDALETTIAHWDNVGTVPGTKLLGHSFDWQRGGGDRTCACGREMPHLFTIGAREVDPSFGAWYWRYDPSLKSAGRTIRVEGIHSLDGSVEIFCCDVCPDRPIKAHWFTG